MSTEKKTTPDVAQEQFEMDASYFDEFAGEGLDTITGSAIGLPYLSLVQPESTFESETHKAGTWRNTASGKNYGNMVDVVVLAFRTIWIERDSQPPFGTIGRYPVNGIKVDIRKPAPGQKGYPKMINPNTGNEVLEMFVYVLMIKDHPEEGILYYTPALSSMKAARKWNTVMKSSLLPNGKQSPIFAFDWNLVADLVVNPKQPTKKIAQLVGSDRGSIVSKDLFENHVKPIMGYARENVMSLTGNDEDTVKEIEYAK